MLAEIMPPILNSSEGSNFGNNIKIYMILAYSNPKLGESKMFTTARAVIDLCQTVRPKIFSPHKNPSFRSPDSDFGMHFSSLYLQLEVGTSGDFTKGAFSYHQINSHKQAYAVSPVNSFHICAEKSNSPLVF